MAKWVSQWEDDNRNIEATLKPRADPIVLNLQGAEWLCEVVNNLMSYDDSDTLALENSFRIIMAV